MSSIVHEVNQWLWQFGRGKLRLGGLLVAANEDQHIALVNCAALAAATRVRRSHKAPKAAEACGGME